MRFRHLNLAVLFQRVFVLAWLLGVVAVALAGRWAGTPWAWAVLAVLFVSGLGMLAHVLRKPFVITTVEGNGTLALTQQGGFALRRVRLPPGSAPAPILRRVEDAEGDWFHCLLPLDEGEILVAEGRSRETVRAVQVRLAEALSGLPAAVPQARNPT